MNKKQNAIIEEVKMPRALYHVSRDINVNMHYLGKRLNIDANFDLVYHVIDIGGRKACMYFINGFCNDDLLQKLVAAFVGVPSKDMPDNVHAFSKKFMPYISVELENNWEQILYYILSGVYVLFIDGYDKCMMIDARSYPARSVAEPEKDKVLRGSKDGFVETVVQNSALIRRRIRSEDLRMEMMNAGKASKTDIIVCYMDSRVDQDLLDMVKTRIRNIQVDALTMNQESLAECLYKKTWWNPFPKFKFTERPDTAAAQILEGNIIILVDNSPSAMIMPTSIFDVIEEADDYYFPPVTGTYLRLTRFIIAVLTYIMTPTFLLMMQEPRFIPEGFEFIMVADTVNIPLIWQFLILELAIDGLKLAAVNTPSMLSTPLSVMAGLVLGEFSVKSGWFNSEVMLYMAFVAIANYTQASYELSYALKFMRIISLILTAAFGIYGYIAGIIVLVISLIFNKTISGDNYVFPLLPLKLKKLGQRFVRRRLKDSKK